MRVAAVAVCLALLALANAQGMPQPDAGDGASAVARARRAHEAARSAAEASPTNTVLVWGYARACFDYAEFATNTAQRADLAQAGIEAGRRAIQLDPRQGATHYYLALNLGQLARTRKLGALSLVGEMEAAFKKARELDPLIAHAGPDRCLGLLYRDAPGWPISVGSKSKARTHLKQAVVLAPAYPENRLTLIESFLAWGQSTEARREVQALASQLPAARRQWVGEEWETAWADWDRRWRDLAAIVGPSETPADTPP